MTLEGRRRDRAQGFAYELDTKPLFRASIRVGKKLRQLRVSKVCPLCLSSGMAILFSAPTRSLKVAIEQAPQYQHLRLGQDMGDKKPPQPPVYTGRAGLL